MNTKEQMTKLLPLVGGELFMLLTTQDGEAYGFQVLQGGELFDVWVDGEVRVEKAGTKVKRHD